MSWTRPAVGALSGNFVMDEKRGRQIGRTDGVMALSVFLWTVGFAGGGAVANIACGGAASQARQRGVLAVVGVLCSSVCLVNLPRRPKQAEA